uniref:Uncharacterized protein n=1 Tax=Cavenderia fasciculata TaxID=261658 RepID=B2XX72_CACFS|nr:hypothetical protein Difao_mp10 [Cavenderia fasciculata]ABX45194.1 hypothetical protein [Cavenderia fasciculata]
MEIFEIKNKKMWTENIIYEKIVKKIKKCISYDRILENLGALFYILILFGLIGVAGFIGLKLYKYFNKNEVQAWINMVDIELVNMYMSCKGAKTQDELVESILKYLIRYWKTDVPLSRGEKYAYMLEHIKRIAALVANDKGTDMTLETRMNLENLVNVFAYLETKSMMFFKYEV